MPSEKPKKKNLAWVFSKTKSAEQSVETLQHVEIAHHIASALEHLAWASNCSELRTETSVLPRKAVDDLQFWCVHRNGLTYFCKQREHAELERRKAT